MSKWHLSKSSQRVGIFCSFASAMVAASAAPCHAEVEGKYTPWIKQLLEKKAYTHLFSNTSKGGSSASNPVQITCLETPGDPFYIGVVQEMTIEARVEEVAKVVEGIDQLVDLFPGYASVKLLSRDDSQAISRWVTSWEQKIPLFFIPNVKYQMIYFINPAEYSRNRQGKRWNDRARKKI
jgi:hypothetical protein